MNKKILVTGGAGYIGSHTVVQLLKAGLSVVVFEEMMRADIHTLVFSSSATVYGDPGYSQYHEDTPLAPMCRA